MYIYSDSFTASKFSIFLKNCNNYFIRCFAFLAFLCCTMWSSNFLKFFLHLFVSHVFHNLCFSGSSFSRSRSFRVQVFQGPGFLGSRFFWVQVFLGLGPGFRSSLSWLLFYFIELARLITLFILIFFPSIAKSAYIRFSIYTQLFTLNQLTLLMQITGKLIFWLVWTQTLR